MIGSIQLYDRTKKDHITHLSVTVRSPRLAELALDNFAHEEVAEEHDVEIRRLWRDDERERPMDAVLHCKELVSPGRNAREGRGRERERERERERKRERARG